MSAGWVAPQVRGRALLLRRFGSDDARSLARLRSLDLAIAELTSTPYGREVRAGMALGAAEHAVSSVLVWHLRILAGWCRPIGANYVRLLGARFEVANITRHLAMLAGQGDSPLFELGSLETAWTRISRAQSLAGVRSVLATSDWGDPQSEDPSVIQIALDFAWARRVAIAVPEAAGWATSYALLVVARVMAAGAVGTLGDGALRDARRLLGPRWEGARSVLELAALAPRRAARLLQGIADPDELWRCEARLWALVESEAAALLRQGDANAGSVVAVVGLLGSDAWRIRAAIELAASGGGDLDGALDAVA